MSIRLLKEKLNAEVITVTVNVGQNEDFEEIEERALKTGATKHYYVDAVEEFASEYLSRCIVMNGLYEEKYPLGTALARPLIASKVVDIARKEGAEAIAHGSTSKGNDQVRFDLTIMALYGDSIVTPVRRWRLTREWEIEYAIKNNVPIEIKKSKFSIDENLWSRSIEGGVIEDPLAPPPEEAFAWTKNPLEAPDKPAELEIEFKAGLPVKINEERMKLHELIMKLNKIGGEHGVGRIDHIENRLVGIKSREVYEAPAAMILISAHKDLEKTVLTPREYRFKRYCDSIWSDLVYQGLWIEPLRETLENIGFKLNKWVTGIVRLRLYKGSLQILGRESTYSLYSRDIASYDKGWYPSEEEARGFIRIWGMHSLTANRVRGNAD